ncbi:MAG: shikimate kinase [Bacteroidetes bacterium]|nr:shikimate kinase [Bacteroidota bacterium]MCH8523475.1 shikimate kinase [Balneolales bacterium]
MNMISEIVLCGFMGAGKSKLGQLLAGMLSVRFEDLDTEIVKYEGLSIPELFTEKGEEYFRKVESRYLMQKVADKNRILSLGGGAMQSQQMINEVKAHNLLIYLDPPFDEILSRVKGSTKRPLLLQSDGTPKPEQELRTQLQQMLASRLPYYQQAHVIFKPDPSWSPIRSATELMLLISSYENTH